MFVFIVGARREGGGGQGGPAVSVPDGGRVCPADLQEAGVLQVGNTRKENQAEKMECGPLPANLFYLNVTQWLVPGWGCLSVCVAVCLCSDTASGVVVSGHLDLPPRLFADSCEQVWNGNTRTNATHKRNCCL